MNKCMNRRQKSKGVGITGRGMGRSKSRGVKESKALLRACQMSRWGRTVKSEATEVERSQVTKGS